MATQLAEAGVHPNKAQAFLGPAMFGDGQVSHAPMTAAGWVINLAVAEWVIRGGRRGVRVRLPHPAKAS